jgi:hypothetical protein
MHGTCVQHPQVVQELRAVVAAEYKHAIAADRTGRAAGSSPRLVLRRRDDAVPRLCRWNDKRTSISERQAVTASCERKPGRARTHVEVTLHRSESECYVCVVCGVCVVCVEGTACACVCARVYVQHDDKDAKARLRGGKRGEGGGVERGDQDGDSDASQLSPRSSATTSFLHAWPS